MNKPLLKFFDALPITEQSILLALAVIYTPINQSSLRNLLKATDGFDNRLIGLLDKTLQTKLQKSKLLVDNKNDWQCSSLIAEPLMRLAVTKVWFTKLAQLLIADNTNYYTYQRDNLIAKHQLKKLRLFLYQNNETGFEANLTRFYQDFPQYFSESMQLLFFNDFDLNWFSSLSQPIRFLVLKYTLEKQRWILSDTKQQYDLLEQFFGTQKPEQNAITHVVIEERLLRGRLENIELWLKEDNSWQALKLLGVLRFMQARYDEALILFQAALKQLRSSDNTKRNAQLDGFASYLLNLCLLQSRTADNLLLLKKNVALTLKMQSSGHFYLINRLLLAAVDVYQAKTPQTSLFDSHIVQSFKENNIAYEHLFYVLLLYWLGESDYLMDKKNLALKQLVLFCEQSETHGYYWYTALSASLLQRLGYKHKACEQFAKRYYAQASLPLLDLLPQIPVWERALHALTQLSVGSIESVQETRLIWLVRMQNDGVQLEPKEQKLSKNGKWTKGRVVSLRRLHFETGQLDYLTVQDRNICAFIKVDHNYDYGSYREQYYLDEQAILAAVGHPYLYWAEQTSFEDTIDIAVSEPQLLVQTLSENQLRLSLVPAIENDKKLLIQKSTHGLQLTVINDAHRQVAVILGEQGLLIPSSAKEQVLNAISSITSLLTVQSDIGGSSNYAEPVLSDSRLHLHLQPIAQGMQIEIFVQPFSEGGPLYKPAEGGSTVLAEIAGKHSQTNRDFELEKNYLEQLFTNCSALERNNTLKWLIDDMETALELLLQLQTLSEFVLLEWPKGKPIRLGREAGLSQARFSVRHEQNWFSLQGELQLDNEQVIGMQTLMELLKTNSGRFLTLDNGQIIALTKELHKRLHDLSHLGELNHDKIKFHPLAIPALHEMTNGMSIQTSKPWQEQLQRLQDLETLKFTVPKSLQGELRDYQLEGFQWLSRLAYWGAGACLADDMGLGKTVQALALILSRANKGATLILAPTSVCINWLEECARFAPDLKVWQFGTGDRQVMLDNIGAFDVLVCSYGLLQSEAKRLAQIHWHTLVADEAQAIKNQATKRSKAAMALKADFKMITTGTPLENHLGELWNLFNFINPGLLGSWSRFTERYANAIEMQRDIGAQQRLKTLLRPFILRRLKRDVLKELPARTEVTLHIELSDEERALYEALRRNAIANIEQATNQPVGQQQLKVLAEIMKLRRVCCHPRLAIENSPLSSSKLQAFEELVDELLDNQHKALVFSQFVGHLTIIRELLQKKGISYQYLDGTTTTANRKKAVLDFQAGEGDLFLISLKAGGTGLNLTAADYVIHTDPWWNPAVEDQASDRAHRMGQLKPVTIYRLIAKDTIEDKIVALHHHKRDLAGSLLEEGGDVSSKLSLDTMLALLKEVD